MSLRWPRTVLVCDVLPQGSVYKPGPDSTEPGTHTRGPCRQPPLPSELQRPRRRLTGAVVLPVSVCAPPAPGLDLTAGRRGAGRGALHTRSQARPSQRQTPHEKFPPTWSVPPPKDDQGEGSETPSTCAGSWVSGSRPRPGPSPLRSSRVTGSSSLRASLAALGHVPEELLALLVIEVLQAVRALKLPLPSPGRCSRTPALCGEVRPLRSSPSPPATGCHKLQDTGL